jgi:hypothetical protein
MPSVVPGTDSPSWNRRVSQNPLFETADRLKVGGDARGSGTESVRLKVYHPFVRDFNPAISDKLRYNLHD